MALDSASAGLVPVEITSTTTVDYMVEDAISVKAQNHLDSSKSHVATSSDGEDDIFGRTQWF